MAVYKRGDVWWYEFIYAGRRIRASAKTTRKTNALEAEKRRRLELERAFAGMASEKPEDRVRDVRSMVAEYRKLYAINHRPKSVVWVEILSRSLDRHLGGVLLPDLTAARVAGFMDTRRKEEAGPRTINMEVGILARCIGSTWRALWPKLRKFDERTDVGRALSSEEEIAILASADKNKSYYIATFIRIALLTALRSDEIRTLRWSQVNFHDGTITVGRAKTAAGTGRVIPMSSNLRSIIETHAAWYAKKVGTIEPDRFVFPLTRRGDGRGASRVDPTQPVTAVSSAWYSVLTNAGVKCRFHDLRHTTITKWAEAGVPEGTIMALAGHVSRAMLERYSHPRMAAKTAAVEGLTLGGVPTKVPTVHENVVVGSSSKVVSIQ